MPGIAKNGIVIASIVLAMVLDLLAPWPYVMTPLYELTITLAALLLEPWSVAAVAAVCFAINVASSLAQHPPPTISIIYSTSNIITGVLAIAVSLQRQRMLKHAQDAETAREQLQRFVGMVSHDIRNPTTAIIGYTQLLQWHVQNGNLERVKTGLADIHHAAQRIRRLTSDVVDATVMNAGQFIIHPERMDLVSTLTEVVSLQQATTATHRLHLETPEHLWGHWDPQRITQVVANLVGNAIKYSPEESEVRVEAWEEGQAAVVAVSDQGIGIAPEAQERLFDLYTREGRERNIEGAGLGLAIARGIVEQHGGRIWVESKLEQGSTFFFKLPLETKYRSVS